SFGSIRGQTDKFLGSVKEYLSAIGRECELIPDKLTQFETTLNALREKLPTFRARLDPPAQDNGTQPSDFAQALAELQEAEKLYESDRVLLVQEIADYRKKFCATLPTTNKEQHATRAAFDPIDERLKGLIKQIDLLYKLAARVIDLRSGPFASGHPERRRE